MWWSLSPHVRTHGEAEAQVPDVPAPPTFADVASVPSGTLAMAACGYSRPCRTQLPGCPAGPTS